MKKYTVHKGQQAAKPTIIFSAFSYKLFWRKLQHSKVLEFDHTWKYEFPEDQYNDCQLDWLKLWGYDVKTIYPANDWTVMLAGRYNPEVNKIQVTGYFNNDGENIHPGSNWVNKKGYPEFEILEFDVPEEGERHQVLTSVFVDKKKRLARIAFGDQRNDNGDLVYTKEVLFKFTEKLGWVAREINFYHGGNCDATQDINLYK